MHRTIVAVPLAALVAALAAPGMQHASSAPSAPGSVRASPSQAVAHYVRFRQGDRIAYGVLLGETIYELSGDPFSSPRRTGRSIRVATVRLLSPLDPAKVSKVIGVAINTKRPGRDTPVAYPRWFAKMPTSINDPDGDVELPPEATNLNYEGELVIIIGKKGRHIPESQAMDYVFGYTVGNDFSENTWYGERQGVNEPTRLISKAVDTWAPIGPAIVTGLDYRRLRVVTRLNGEVVQDGATNEYINDFPNIISNISRYVTLLPGDVIFPGTVLFKENARRAMQVGDIVEVQIQGIGKIRNRIVAMPVPATAPAAKTPAAARP